MRRSLVSTPSVIEEEIDDLAPIITRLRHDLRAAAAELRDEEARYLVDLYYQLQAFRIRSANMLRSGETEPNRLLRFFLDGFLVLERTIPRAMDVYTDQSPLGRWAKGIYGVGPILAAGLYAHIDVRRAATAGAVWRFAGLDPTCTWQKGQKRPWNADLKVLCWKLGQSFWKFHKREECVYGQLIAARKLREAERNLAEDFRETAAQTLAARKIGDAETRATYASGQLPKGRIQRRAERYGVKLFLAHYWQVGRESLGLPVPTPYVLTQKGHTHFLGPPNWP